MKIRILACGLGALLLLNLAPALGADEKCIKIFQTLTNQQSADFLKPASPDHFYASRFHASVPPTLPPKEMEIMAPRFKENFHNLSLHKQTALFHRITYLEAAARGKIAGVTLPTALKEAFEKQRFTEDRLMTRNLNHILHRPRARLTELYDDLSTIAAELLLTGQKSMALLVIETLLWHVTPPQDAETSRLQLLREGLRLLGMTLLTQAETNSWDQLNPYMQALQQQRCPPEEMARMIASNFGLYMAKKKAFEGSVLEAEKRFIHLHLTLMPEEVDFDSLVASDHRSRIDQAIDEVLGIREDFTPFERIGLIFHLLEAHLERHAELVQKGDLDKVQLWSALGSES